MKKVFLFLILITLGLISCTKEGIQGPAGTDGTNGIDGKDGNANVTSINKVIGTDDWMPKGTAGIDLYYYVEINIPEITSTIASNGTILVYLVSTSGGYYYALPFSLPESSWITTFNYGYQKGKVEIDIQDSDNNTFRPDNSITFKIVLIDGSVNTLGMNLKDFNTIKELLGR